MSYGLESVGLSPVGLPSGSSGGSGTNVECATGALTLVGLPASVSAAVAVICTAAVSENAGLAATVAEVTGEISITTPTAYRAYQRNGSNQADIAISGTYTGSPTTIEASFNGGAYSTIVASPADGTFSATLSAQAMGQGTLTVRFSNNTGIAATVAYVTIGDIFIVHGQSNHVGQATSFVAPSTAAFRAVELGLNNVWSEVLETDANPFSDNTSAAYTPHQTAAAAGNGSYLGALATKIMAQGVPVAFVPCALGSTSISGHLPFTDHHSTSSLYGVALTRAELAGDHKAMLWWQGENDAVAGTSQSTYETSLNTLINAWHADTGKQVVVYSINTAGAGSTANNAAIRAAQRKVARSNSHAIPGPQMAGVWPTNVHYTTTNDINAVADQAFKTLSANYYGGTVISCGAGESASAGLAAGVNAVTVTATVAEIDSVGLSATVSVSSDVSANTAEIANVGQPASVASNFGINCSAAQIVSTGLAAGVALRLEIDCGLAAVSIAGLAASIGASLPAYASAPAGSGYSPKRDNRQSRPANTQRSYR